MISERISDDIPPQMKILTMVIPILMHYQHFPFEKTVKMYFVALIRPAAASCKKTACQLHIFTCQPMESDVTYCRRVSDSISQDILSQIYDVIQSDVALHLQVH